MVDWLSFLSTIIAVLGGAAAAGTGGQLVVRLLQMRSEERKQERIGERVDRLTRSLKEAIDLIDQIEGEIRERQSLATRLQADIQSYERLAELKAEEVEAVTQLLRAELHSDARRFFWRAAVLNSLFFLLGVSVTVAVAVAF
jgi:hypothetical protein